jgi:hypothetical protein
MGCASVPVSWEYKTDEPLKDVHFTAALTLVSKESYGEESDKKLVPQGHRESKKWYSSSSLDFTYLTPVQ